MTPKRKMITGAILLVAGISTLYIQGEQNSDAQTNTEEPKTMLSTIAPSEFEGQLEGRTVLDVRTAEEYEHGHLPGARNIDFYDTDAFRTEIDSLDRDAPYALYCRSGNRSGQTLVMMRKLGFTNVIDLHGGLVAWEREGKSTCTTC